MSRRVKPCKISCFIRNLLFLLLLCLYYKLVYEQRKQTPKLCLYYKLVCEQRKQTSNSCLYYKLVYEQRKRMLNSCLYYKLLYEQRQRTSNACLTISCLSHWLESKISYRDGNPNILKIAVTVKRFFTQKSGLDSGP